MDLPVDEAAMVRAAMDGEREAFVGLVRLHQARLRMLVAMTIPVRDDVHDVVQETFIDAWLGMPCFEAGREFWPWLRTICRNRVNKFLRDRLPKRRRELALVDAALIEAPSPAEDIPEQQMSALRSCLAALDPNQRQLLVLRYHDELAVQDIAEKLGKNANTVSMALIRLKAALMRCVASRIGATA